MAISATEGMRIKIMASKSKPEPRSPHELGCPSISLMFSINISSFHALGVEEHPSLSGSGSRDLPASRAPVVPKL